VPELMLCVNHWRNGAFIGRARSVALGDALTLESPYADASLRCRLDARTFGLGARRTWPHCGHATWVGNWCWDAVRVTPATAADVLNFTLGRGYRPESGFVELWDKIDAGRPLTAEDLVEALQCSPPP